MTMSHVAVPGGRLLVVDEGTGPPIVLLHAGIADHRAWEALVPPLTAAGYRAIRYDARGFGASTTEDVAFSRRADLIAVLDALLIGRAVLVGNSLGGMVAFDAAIRSPDASSPSSASVPVSAASMADRRPRSSRSSRSSSASTRLCRSTPRP